jgi:hypothetical protein
MAEWITLKTSLWVGLYEYSSLALYGNITEAKLGAETSAS